MERSVRGELKLTRPVPAPRGGLLKSEGPNWYLYFEVSHPRELALVHDFLRVCESPSSETELKLSDCGGHSVEFLWDRNAGDRCFILISDENEFRLRLTLLREDLQALVSSLARVRDALSKEGLLAAAV